MLLFGRAPEGAIVDARVSAPGSLFLPLLLLSLCVYQESPILVHAFVVEIVLMFVRTPTINNTHVLNEHIRTHAHTYGALELVRPPESRR